MTLNADEKEHVKRLLHSRLTSEIAYIQDHAYHGHYDPEVEYDRRMVDLLGLDQEVADAHFESARGIEGPHHTHSDHTSRWAGQPFLNTYTIPRIASKTTTIPFAQLPADQYLSLSELVTWSVTAQRAYNRGVHVTSANDAIEHILGRGTLSYPQQFVGATPGWTPRQRALFWDNEMLVYDSVRGKTTVSPWTEATIGLTEGYDEKAVSNVITPQMHDFLRNS